jgi:hypothetical protein
LFFHPRGFVSGRPQPDFPVETSCSFSRRLLHHSARTLEDVAWQDLSDLAFAQEYLAQFVSWEGAVFRKILDAIQPPGSTPEGSPIVIGVDWGRTNDYTVFVVLSDAGQVLEIDRFRGLEYSLQRGRLASLYQRYRQPTIIAESNAMGLPVIEQLARDGLKVRPFVTTNASKAMIIEALALAFEQQQIHIPNDPVLIGELQSFEGKPLPGGLMTYSAAARLHDDCVMALAIAWQGMGTAKKRAAAASAFQNLMWANDQLATGCGFRENLLPSENGGRQHWGSGERTRILRERWRD